jgi:3D (Asp-Asp-Asp) domain-containing protein
MRNKEGSLLKRILAPLACLALVVPGAGAKADTTDPVGDLLGQIAAQVAPILETFGLKATLYHGGGRGIRDRDALGCKVVPMRTAAVDGVMVHKGELIYIKETVGLPMPDGRLHDGYWYASDTGGAIHKGRIDLFTGDGAGSMAPLMPLNLATLTVARVGLFAGCPKA